MPVNQYFNHYNAQNEQNLQEDLLIELIQMSGQMIHYIPKKFNKLDTIFGEDILMSFDRTYQIEMYFNSPNGFEGDRYMLSKLGYSMPKQASFIVSRRRFNEVWRHEGAFNLRSTDITDDSEVRPMEGDLIYYPITKDYWEIKFVDHESPHFYQFGKNMVWNLTVEKWRGSFERFDTGVAEIDQIAAIFDQLPDLENDPIADNKQIKTEAAKIVQDFDPDNPFAPGK